MIRLNDIPANEEQKNRHNFNAMIRAAKPSFLAVQVDEANHIANGLLESDNGDGYRAILSYEGQKRHVMVAVTLKPTRHLSDQQRDVLEQLQSSSEMCRFDPDREHRLLTLRASSVCSQPKQPKFTVRQIIQDICRVLADDRLKVVLNG